jgi:hypothetical protein
VYAYHGVTLILVHVQIAGCTSVSSGSGSNGRVSGPKLVLLSFGERTLLTLFLG